MPTATQKNSRRTQPRSSNKESGAQKPAHGANPYALTQIDELKSQLRLFTEPDFSYGDYWPKLDQRLYGHLPDLIHRVLAVLEVRFPRPAGTRSRCCECHARDE